MKYFLIVVATVVLFSVLMLLAFGFVFERIWSL